MDQRGKTPPQTTPPLDQNSPLFAKDWWLFFQAMGARSASTVLGSLNLKRINRIVKVTAAGTVGEARFVESEVVYVVKAVQSGLVALAATLTLADAGKLVYVTDYAHTLEWSGTVWAWAPNEPGSGMLVPFAVAPTGSGWHACDGTVAAYLKADGTTATVTLPNTVASAAYLQLGAAYAAAITLAAVPVISIPTFTGTAGNTGAASAGSQLSGPTANTLTQSAHTHSFTPAGTVSRPTATLPTDPIANCSAILYFRQ